MHHHFLLVTSVKNLKTDCALTTKKQKKNQKDNPKSSFSLAVPHQAELFA